MRFPYSQLQLSGLFFNFLISLPLHFSLTQLVLILDREKVLAVKALEKGEKDKALIALRRKRYQESLLSKTDSQLETLEGLVSLIPFKLNRIPE